MTTCENFEKAYSAIVTVGDGRGFIVGDNVITAAHCLPRFPPYSSASYIDERTFPNLLAPLGKEPSVWAECLFVDPVGDIAVLGIPDAQALYREAMEYTALVEREGIESMEIESPSNEGWLLSLNGLWFNCGIEQVGETGQLWLYCPMEKIVGGTSGSPVISASGAAVGIVCISSEGHVAQALQGPNPSLIRNLPGWFLSEIRAEA